MLAARIFNSATHAAAFALPNFVIHLLEEGGALVTDAGVRLAEHAEMQQALEWGSAVRSDTLDTAVSSGRPAAP
jgi:hypothetical protein